MAVKQTTRWQSFLDEIIPDKHVQKQAQKFLGHALMQNRQGENSEEQSLGGRE